MMNTTTFTESLSNNLQAIVLLLQKNLPFLLTMLGLLWAIQIFNFLTGYRLNRLGLYPRTIHGLPGIFFAPFLHGSFSHLFFNSIPLIALANLVLLAGQPFFYRVSFLIIVISGIATWLFGRRGYHVGASGLIMGYFGLILANAYHEATFVTIVSCIIGLYYFGGLLLHLLPSEVEVSWEGHLFGFLAGVIAAFEKQLFARFI